MVDFVRLALKKIAYKEKPHEFLFFIGKFLRHIADCPAQMRCRSG